MHDSFISITILYMLFAVVGKHACMNIGIYNVNYVSNNKILSYDAKNMYLKCDYL